MKKILVIVFACVNFNCFGLEPYNLPNEELLNEYTNSTWQRFLIVMKKIEQAGNMEKETLKVILAVEAALIEEEFQREIAWTENFFETEPKKEKPDWQRLYNSQIYYSRTCEALGRFRELVSENMSK